MEAFDVTDLVSSFLVALFPERPLALLRLSDLTDLPETLLAESALPDL